MKVDRSGWTGIFLTAENEADHALLAALVASIRAGGEKIQEDSLDGYLLAYRKDKGDLFFPHED